MLTAIARFCLLAVGLALSASAANAGAPTDDQIKASLTAGRTNIVLDAYGRVYAGAIGDPKEDVVVAHFTTCPAGGNACGSTFGVFVARDDAITELPLASLPNGQVVDVSVKANHIFVKSKSFLPADPHCCPSIPHRQIYEVSQGTVKRIER